MTIESANGSGCDVDVDEERRSAGHASARPRAARRCPRTPSGPRDSWPAQPVSTVSDRAQIAKQPMSA